MDESLKKRINELNKHYDNNNLLECCSTLVFLALYYNSEIRKNHVTDNYDYELKRLLLKINFIKNPMGIKYTEKDYKKTNAVLISVLKHLSSINRKDDEKINNIYDDELEIDTRIIKDIIELAIYTKLFHKMNLKNTKKIRDSEFGKYPFVEQILNIFLFHQDQIRLVRDNYDNFFDDKCISGLELSIANRPINYFEDKQGSLSDSLELTLEGFNELVHYLYYKYNDKFKDKITIDDINTEIIAPYDNVDFEKYLYIAFQRHLLSNVEEHFRYGYFGVTEFRNEHDDQNTFAFSIQNVSEYKARFIGVFRRENQIQSYILVNSNAYGDVILNAEKTISNLAIELINHQLDSFIFFDFSKFHPDKNEFVEADGVTKSKLDLVKHYTKEYYLECTIKDVKINDYLYAYKYLTTLSEILYYASQKFIDNKNPKTYLKEISIVEISYLNEELARIYGFEINYAKKLIDRFVLHERNNRYEDVFSQPLLKISKSQVVLCQSLIDQINIDRTIERQFIRFGKDYSEIGHMFERHFINLLQRGYQKNTLLSAYKKIPNLNVNTNKVKYTAFDGKDIEFDFIATLENYLILVELKAMMCSYDISDLAKRKMNIKEAISQLKRRAESVVYDWDIFKQKVSIDLPIKSYDKEHIVLIACTDSYDFTPLKFGDVYITDDSTFLKYFTHPYLSTMEFRDKFAKIDQFETLWKKGSPNVEEFKEYLLNPVTSQLFSDNLSTDHIPIVRLDNEDDNIYFEDYKLNEDPIKNTVKNNSKLYKNVKRKIGANDPCPCGSGKKYKKCCRNK